MTLSGQSLCVFPSHSSSILSPVSTSLPGVFAHPRCDIIAIQNAKPLYRPIIIHYYPHQASGRGGRQAANDSELVQNIGADSLWSPIISPYREPILQQSINNATFCHPPTSHSPNYRPNKMHHLHHSLVCKLYSAIQLLYSG